MQDFRRRGSETPPYNLDRRHLRPQALARAVGPHGNHPRHAFAAPGGGRPLQRTRGRRQIRRAHPAMHVEHRARQRARDGSRIGINFQQLHALLRLRPTRHRQAQRLDRHRFRQYHPLAAQVHGSRIHAAVDERLPSLAVRRALDEVCDGLPARGKEPPAQLLHQPRLRQIETNPCRQHLAGPVEDVVVDVAVVGELRNLPGLIM